MMTNLDLPVSYTFKAKDATKVCFHTNNAYRLQLAYHMHERNVVKLCSRTCASWYETIYIVIRFFFKAIQNNKTGRVREKQKDGKDARQMCPITHKYLPHALRTVTSLGPAELARETDGLPYFSWSLWTITTLQSALLPKTSPVEDRSCRKIKRHAFRSWIRG